MNILINASNLSGGGGVQVADSICRYLKYFDSHKFIVVVSSVFDRTIDVIQGYDNVVVKKYDYPKRDWRSFITLRNNYLDNLVLEYGVECVYTVFGPMKWKPKCQHVCGFALAHVVMPESPYFMKMTFAQRILWLLRIKIWEIIFRRSSKYFVTENPLITKRLQEKFVHSEVYTITNYYNQVFDDIEFQENVPLTAFDGVTILTIGTNYQHKNLIITREVAKILKRNFPHVRFRFVLTIEQNEFPTLDDDIKECFTFLGKVSVNKCPSLYKQSDIAFIPTLLECFSAAYPEAMRMSIPIVTTDLEFSNGLCEDAALYYDPLDASDAAEKLYQLMCDTKLREGLIVRGREKLLSFDNNFDRISKVINLCNQVVQR